MGPVPHHPYNKEFLLMCNLILPSFKLKLFPLVVSLHALMKTPFPVSLQAPFRWWMLLEHVPRAFLAVLFPECLWFFIPLNKGTETKWSICVSVPGSGWLRCEGDGWLCLPAVPYQIFLVMTLPDRLSRVPPRIYQQKQCQNETLCASAAACGENMISYLGVPNLSDIN